MFIVHDVAHHILKIGSTRSGKVIYSVLAGSMGAVILVLFLTGMTYSATIGDLLPVIIGFNTAITGYMVLEKTRDGFTHMRLAAIGSGVVMVLFTAAVLNIMFLRGAGIVLIGIEQLMILVLVGIITSGLGGLLAIKFFSLEQSAKNKNCM